MWELMIAQERISRHFTRLEWSGGIKGTSRVLEVEYDDDMTSKMEIGSSVILLKDNERLFVGRIFSKDNSANKGTFSFKAFDDSVYLNKNRFVKNIYEQTPSQILKMICGEIGLRVGKFPQDKVKLSFPAIDKSGYEIILQAYTIQHKKDKQIYSVVCNDGKIEIAHQGILLEDTILDSREDIQEAQYSQSIENMINQIIIYKTENDKLQIIDKVSNESDKKKYGLFQNVMEYEEDVNNIYNAREMLKGLENKANITVIGDVNLQSGYTVAVRQAKIGLIGTFLIERDVHVIEDGNYYTNLELSFENKMDKVEFEEYKKKKEKKKKIKQKKAKKKEYSVVEGEDYIYE